MIGNINAINMMFTITELNKALRKAAWENNAREGQDKLLCVSNLSNRSK